MRSLRPPLGCPDSKARGAGVGPCVPTSPQDPDAVSGLRVKGETKVTFLRKRRRRNTYSITGVCLTQGRGWWQLSESALAAVTKHADQGLQQQARPSHRLEAGSPRSGCQCGWVLVRGEPWFAGLQVAAFLLYLHVAKKEITPLLSLPTTALTSSRGHHSSCPNYLPKAPSPTPSHRG